jgi:YHS domain-containing protein
VLRFLLLAILLLLVARAFWKLVDGITEAAGGASRRRDAGRPVPLVRDPVCGTHVPASTSLSLRTGGSLHHFCSEKCRDEFSRQRTAGARR